MPPKLKTKDLDRQKTSKQDMKDFPKKEKLIKKEKPYRKLSEDEVGLRLARKWLKEAGYGFQEKANYLKSSKEYLEKKRSVSNSTISANMQCPICLDMLMSPAVTSCGHTYCFSCLEEHFLRSSFCPTCRQLVRNQEFKVSKQSEILIKNHHEKNMSNYKEKLQNYEKWKTDRWLKPMDLKEGQEIDARDTEFIWCRAKIIKMLYDKNDKLKELLVHYQGWNKVYDEIISIESQRIAPYGFFSGRADIPKYFLNQPQDNIRSRIEYPERRGLAHALHELQNLRLIPLQGDNNEEVIEIESSNSQLSLNSGSQPEEPDNESQSSHSLNGMFSSISQGHASQEQAHEAYSVVPMGQGGNGFRRYFDQIYSEQSLEEIEPQPILIEVGSSLPEDEGNGQQENNMVENSENEENEKENDGEQP